MTKEHLSEILKQLKEAHQKGLIQDYMHVECYRYLYILFKPETPNNTKMAISDYFIRNHNTQNLFINMDHILRITFSP